jgi:hypothetical protein
MFPKAAAKTNDARKILRARMAASPVALGDHFDPRLGYPAGLRD